MNSDIVIGIGHPAHVHFYKNAIKELSESGYKVHVVSKRRPLAIDLLQNYGIEHKVAGRLRIQHDSLLKTALSFASFELDMINEARKHNPSVVTGVGNIPLSHASAIFDCESLIFTDTEHAELANRITFPFADRIYTPDCYIGDIGIKQVRYPSYHELAYLHPKRFEPDPTVLDDVNVNPDDSFVILRLVAWNAIHDMGDSGFENLHDIVTALEETGVEVFITSEAPLPESVSDRRLTIEPHRIHDLMYYADLFIGESATMATESAVLGTPAIFVSSSRRGYTNELEDEYGLVFNYSGPNRQINGLNQAISILDEYDETVWRKRREQLLKEKIDTTDFIIDQITSRQS
ncbi:DUF354 domain-containing protein [Natronomonas salsuginis]|uniref:DUF354 domain-containing protein n=1 Tax=Natronomonas salsuginis TaxID=2217661 RepID=A0A4U5JHC2_9EURY|nr:DUF354 domain-containing protein [Natronomonas salsuginis]TKR25459.1 DUF354 domain-containing protein [Natronomonas salsuginis]